MAKKLSNLMRSNPWMRCETVLLTQIPAVGSAIKIRLTKKIQWSKYVQFTLCLNHARLKHLLELFCSGNN